MVVALAGDRYGSGSLLMGAAALLYGAARLMLHALARHDSAGPGRRAVGQWAPIAATVLAAIAMRQPEIAVSVVFGTSVALLSLVLGMVTYFAPLESLPTSRRVWPFVLPAALIPLMAGFSGHLGPGHALLMLLLGAALLGVWKQEPAPIDAALAPEIAGTARATGSASIPLILTAAGLALCGSYLAIRGIQSSSRGPYTLEAGTISTTILSPLLVLPALWTAPNVASQGQSGRAVTALVGTVLLNLCLLLPVTIILWWGMSAISGATAAAAATQPALLSLSEHAKPLPYPMAAWRLGTGLLVVLGFALFPMAAGRWLVGRLESALLILGYFIYLAVLTVLAVRMA